MIRDVECRMVDAQVFADLIDILLALARECLCNLLNLLARELSHG